MCMPWQIVVAIFWSGMFVEAVLGNIVGYVSSPEALIGDVLIIVQLLIWAWRPWRRIN